ncbi:MAG: hypothetical protein H0U26_08745 [Acidimicrobiia bacterium]|nr:hypothetical protein [Acidimicrobiia bacterium]
MNGGGTVGAVAVEERREEDRKERVDRELIELLNELRVALPGVQVLFAFLLTVPFTQRFDVLDAGDRRVYFATVLLTAATSGFLIAPAAHHRLRFRADVATKESLLHVANVLAILGTVALALAMGSVVYVIASVLYTGGVVRVSAAAVVTLTALLWFALPFTALASGEPVARSRR